MSTDFCKDAGMGVVCRLLLVPKGQAVAIPVEDLDAVAAAISEDEEVSRKWILADHVADQSGEAIKAVAHVGGFDGEEDAQRGG